jgi:hypothetical protein
MLHRLYRGVGRGVAENNDADCHAVGRAGRTKTR